MRDCLFRKGLAVGIIILFVGVSVLSIGIPKAAVSRNIQLLELKGLIEKEQIGISNLIRLKKP